MTISRRDAIAVSGSAIVGLSVGRLDPRELAAQVAVQEQEFPDRLIDVEPRATFPVDLPLNPDGSAPEHPESAAGPIRGRLMWRTSDRRAPEIEYDYTRMAIRVDTRGLGTKRGTMRFSDLEPLTRVSHTFLMQCGAPEPTGIVKWTGVRFTDFADMLGLVPGAHYCRLTASDGHYVDESVEELRHPQVMLVWMMNEEPLDPQHGAPLRLVMPFRYGNRSIKAITEIIFGTPGLPRPGTG
jgi:DMSO/TMAO reductase YedYZ molybdopterin-dependent catalytic subunit